MDKMPECLSARLHHVRCTPEQSPQQCIEGLPFHCYLLTVSSLKPGNQPEGGGMKEINILYNSSNINHHFAQCRLSMFFSSQVLDTLQLVSHRGVGTGCDPLILWVFLREHQRQVAAYLSCLFPCGSLILMQFSPSRHGVSPVAPSNDLCRIRRCET